MNVPKPKDMLFGAREAPRTVVAPNPDRAWRAAHVFGVFLLLVGLVDIGLALSQPNLADANWRFATMASLVGGLPLPALGLLVGLMASTARDRRVARGIWALLNALLGLFLVVGLVAFFTAVGEVRAATPVGAAADVGRLVFRTPAIGAAFAALHLWAAAWSLSRGSDT